MRPTKYKKEFGDEVVKLMKKGYSIQEICLEFEISKQTFYNWCEQHQEFLDSKEKGEFFSEGWWIKQGRENLENGKFNYTGWYMQMKNRFKWTDRQETTLEGGEKPIKTELDYSGLSDQALKEIAQLDKSKS